MIVCFFEGKWESECESRMIGIVGIVTMNSLLSQRMIDDVERIAALQRTSAIERHPSGSVSFTMMMGISSNNGSSNHVDSSRVGHGRSGVWRATAAQETLGRSLACSNLNEVPQLFAASDPDLAASSEAPKSEPKSTTCE